MRNFPTTATTISPAKPKSFVKLQILGTGCAKCNALTQAAEKAAQMLGLPYELEKVTDLNRIMSFGVMMTPALAVNGTVKVVGKVPSVAEIKTILSQAAVADATK